MTTKVLKTMSMKIIVLACVICLVGCFFNSCSKKDKTNSDFTTETCNDNDECDSYYRELIQNAETSLDEDIDKFEYDDESGVYFIHTSIGNLYTIMDLGGGIFSIYDSNGNSVTSMDLGGGYRVATDNYGNTYNSMDLGGGMTITTDNYGNSYNTIDLGGGISVTTDNYGNSYQTMDLGDGMTIITDNNGNSTTIFEY